MTQIRKVDKITLLVEKKKRAKAIANAKPLELPQLFPAQDAFINDQSRFIAAQCSRRAGKSNGLALRFFKTMDKYPGSQCIYLALTRESAFSIMWSLLQEFNDKYSLGCKFIESRLTMVHPNGAKLRLLGADSKNFVKRIKGIKSPGVAIDEAQDFGVHLQSLIDDVLTPTIADYADGWLALTGTPGPVPNGYFFEVTQGRKHGYTLHQWTILDNPHMPNATKFIEELKVKRQWPDDNPTLLREWRNKWVLDVQSLWVRYKEDVNHYAQLPALTPGLKYNYIMGVDIGFNDADAIAVLAWHESTPIVYLVEELITRKQGVTDLAKQIEMLRLKYDTYKIVIDAGALGKKVAEELIRRHQLPIEAADKTRKQENVEFLNDSLRIGTFKAKSSSQFAQDSYLVQIDWDKSTPDKIVVKKHPHSDIIDSVLYAYKVSPAYTYQKAPTKPKPGTKEYAYEQETNMFEDTLAKLQEEDAYNKYTKNLGFGES